MHATGNAQSGEEIDNYNQTTLTEGKRRLVSNTLLISRTGIVRSDSAIEIRAGQLSATTPPTQPGDSEEKEKSGGRRREIKRRRSVQNGAATSMVCLQVPRNI